MLRREGWREEGGREIDDEDRGADPWLFADMMARLGLCLSSSVHMLATRYIVIWQIILCTLTTCTSPPLSVSVHLYLYLQW